MFKRKLIFAVLVLIAAILYSTKLSAQEIVKTYDNKDFNSVSLSHAMNCQLTQSDKYSIEIKADEEDFEYLKVEQKGNSIRIYIDKNNYSSDSEIKVKITMPELTDLNLSGASKVKLTMNVPGKNFSSKLSGSSYIEGSLTSGDIDISLSGSSKVKLNGKADDLDLHASGSSSLKLKDFAVKNADVQLSGSSLAELNLNGKLNTRQSGNSQIIYYGKADLGSTNFSGSSGIKKGE
jgi:hypothetical protein